jgi:hypothetical protein
MVFMIILFSAGIKSVSERVAYHLIWRLLLAQEGAVTHPLRMVILSGPTGARAVEHRSAACDPTATVLASCS